MLKTAKRGIAYTYHPDMYVPLERKESSVLGLGDKVTSWDYDDPNDPIDDPDVFNENPTSLPYRIIEQGYTAINTDGDIEPYTYITTFTYNGWGQVKTIDGPRTDVGDTTTFTYDEETQATPETGDLLSVTRPHIGVTSFSAYRLASHALE